MTNIELVDLLEKAIRSDYKTYVNFCKQIGMEPMNLYSFFKNIKKNNPSNSISIFLKILNGIGYEVTKKKD